VFFQITMRNNFTYRWSVGSKAVNYGLPQKGNVRLIWGAGVRQNDLLRGLFLGLYAAVFFTSVRIYFYID
jgi:hypothetical protein